MTSRKDRLGWLLGIFVLLAATPPARAQAGDRERAKAHFAAGESRFKSGDYRGAIVEFTAADALVPSPILAFNIALAHEKLGEDDSALRLYRDYLSRRPDAPNRATVEARIADLDARIAARRPVSPPPQQPPPFVTTPDLDQEPVEQAPPTAPPAEQAPRSYDDALARRVPSRNDTSMGGGSPGYQVGQGPPEAQAPHAGPSELPPAEPAPQPRKSTPVYKQWWFWVVVGVSAIILIDFAVGPDEGNAATSGDFGATILRW